MKKIITIAFIALMLSGCNAVETNETKAYEAPKSYERLRVYTRCEDRVVCYHHGHGHNGSGGCFRDEDLFMEYCDSTSASD